MSPIRHVIMTRFNLATIGREEGYRRAEGWLEGRFGLFERYCLPTVAAQSCQDFDWIIYFDEATPGWARERALKAQRSRGFRACYTHLFGKEGWRNTVLDLVGDDRREALLTTTLDNDDGLAVDYVERVQQCALEWLSKVPVALNFTNGFVFRSPALYLHDHPSNAFVNLLEPYGSRLRTASGVRHMELATHMPVVQVQGAPAWLQVVHDHNVSNRIRGRRVPASKANGRFAADLLEIKDPHPLARGAERMLLSPARRTRDLAARLYRRIVPVH